MSDANRESAIGFFYFLNNKYDIYLLSLTFVTFGNVMIIVLLYDWISNVSLIKS